MELRNNRFPDDQYEEVESPFASKSSEKQSAHRERIRSRKNVFNRPFATESTNAPTYFETTSTRRSVGHPDQSELISTRRSSLGETEIDYLNDEEVDEEEQVQKTPARSSSSHAKKKIKSKQNIIPKIAWSVIGLLVLRLICMDRGVWDYFSTESVIREKNRELASIRVENKELSTEITRVQLDKGFQRQLAKEHLGVIAADEFLILFAGESNDLPEDVKKTL